MPVLHVYVPPAPDLEERMLAGCRAVGSALGLPAGDVIAVHVPTAAVVRPGHREPEWPVVVIHGSARDREVMDAAIDALREEVRTWTREGEAWVSWQVPG